MKKKNKTKVYLRPCPFCAKTPTITEASTRFGSVFYIACETLVCAMDETGTYDNSKTLIRLWNKRA